MKKFKPYGYPYYYGDYLSEKEAYFRFRIIYIYLMFVLSTNFGLSPSAAVILPLPSCRPSMERIQLNEPSSQFTIYKFC